MLDKEYMRLAISLAKKGEGFVNPNPLVGAVIVKDGKIIGEGYHEQYGGLHAERNAFLHLKESAEGATIYVTLEPCCHHGKTPPCTEAIIEHKIVRVVIGSRDPNPLVAGKGAKILREHGIVVEEDVLREECDALNPVFFHYIQNQTPYVVMKYAMTLDGKIAAYTGKSQWVTGEISRNYVQKLRHRYMGIMVGVSTVLCDNPMLNCRMEGGKNPVRIICDSNLRTPLESKLVQSAEEIPVILATTCSDIRKHQPYLDYGCEVLVISEKDGKVDLQELMKKLGEKKIDSILLEGGATLNWSALEAGIVQEVKAFVAPKLFGGITAKSPIGGIGVEAPDMAYYLKDIQTCMLGEDFLIEAKLEDYNTSSIE